MAEDSISRPGIRPAISHQPSAIDLLLLLCLAAAVRFYGLRFGLPHVWARPDELVVVDIGKEFLRGDLNPHFWDYPSLFMYILGAADYGYYLFGRAIGWFDSVDHFLSLWATNWPPFFVIARVVSAVAGTATVALTYLIAARLFDRLTACIGAFFLALAYLHVRDSHFGVTDVTMAFFVMLSLWFLVRGVLDDSRVAFAAAGAAAGAGASIKYNVVIVLAALASAVVVVIADARLKPRAPSEPRAPSGRALFGSVALFVAFFVVAFLVGTPYALVERRLFLEGLSRQMQHVATPHGFDLGPGGIYHLVFTLRHGVGIPVLVAGIAGLAWAFRIDWRRALLLAAFPVAYYVVLAPSRTVFVRYAIPLVPFLCVGAAVVAAAVARMSSRRFGVAESPAAAVLALVLIAPSAYNVAQIDRLFGTADNREVLAGWIRTNMPRGSSVYFSGNRTLHPIVDMGALTSVRAWTHRSGTEFAENRQPVDGLPDWIVIGETGVPEYNYCPPEVRSLAEKEYRVAAVLKAMDFEGTLFDRQDAFFYPYAGFRSVRRGGPNFVVYARAAK